MTRPSSIVHRPSSIVFFLLACAASAPVFAQAPVTYRVSFPEPHHHWMQVEVTFAEVPAGPLQVLMSRTSPGRYAVHEFARNVYDVQVDNGAGAALPAARPNPAQWDVSGHAGLVRVRYKVFGDEVDGTYLGVSSTHAHINIPASLMWARGLEDRPARVTFAPADPSWKVATQLHPTGDPHTFVAANLPYLIDSPVELSNHTVRSFTVAEPFRIALHHDGSDRDADRFASDVERIVREERAIFGELPAFEAPYTFITDLLPDVGSDGMEHRNSTIITFPGALRNSGQRLEVLDAVAHEFFHSWNVERIRPRSIEPFKLDEPNTSGELWFGEGFTNYYHPLVLHRAGLADLPRTAATMGDGLDTVIRGAARKHRSAEEMSRLAQYMDGAEWRDRTNLGNTFISYYTWGAAIGLGLDLSLRARSDHRVTLDDYMRAMWQDFGRSRGAVEGTVARPYTIEDLRDVLARVSGDRAFANDFFNRYIQGREVVDYEPLLARAGLVLRKQHPGSAWIGPLAIDVDRGGARVSEATHEGTPVHAAGLDRGDRLIAIDGEPVDAAERLGTIVQRRKPGDRLRITIRRGEADQDVTLAIEEDPRLELVPVENTGRNPTSREKAFREAWLGSKQ